MTKKNVVDVTDKMKQAVQAQDYQKLARLGVEQGVFFLKGQERRKEPSFMPELFLFKDGKLKGIRALAGVTTLTAYSFADGLVREQYSIAPSDFLEALFAGKLADTEKPDVVLLIGSAWSKPQVKTEEQFRNSPKHYHQAVVAFANVYLEPKNVTATHAHATLIQKANKKSQQAAALNAA